MICWQRSALDQHISGVPVWEVWALSLHGKLFCFEISFEASESISCSPREDAGADGPVLTVPLSPVLLWWLHTLIEQQNATQSTVALVFLPFAPSFGFFLLSCLVSSFFYALWLCVPFPPFLLSEHRAMKHVGFSHGAVGNTAQVGQNPSHILPFASQSRTRWAARLSKKKNPSTVGIKTSKHLHNRSACTCNQIYRCCFWASLPSSGGFLEINELEMRGCLYRAFQRSSVLGLLLSCQETCAVFSQLSFHSAHYLLDCCCYCFRNIHKKKKACSLLSTTFKRMVSDYRWDEFQVDVQSDLPGCRAVLLAALSPSLWTSVVHQMFSLLGKQVVIRKHVNEKPC